MFEERCAKKDESDLIDEPNNDLQGIFNEA